MNLLLLKQNFKNIFKSLWNNLSVNKSSAALESQLNYSNSAIPFKQLWKVLSNTLYLTLKLNPRITISSKFSKHFPLWSYSGQTICWRSCKRIRGLPQNWSCRTRPVLVKHVICVQETLCGRRGPWGRGRGGSPATAWGSAQYSIVGERRRTSSALAIGRAGPPPLRPSPPSWWLPWTRRVRSTRRASRPSTGPPETVWWRGWTAVRSAVATITEPPLQPVVF